MSTGQSRDRSEGHVQPVAYWQIIGNDGRARPRCYGRYSLAIGQANLMDRPVTVQGFDRHGNKVPMATCTFVGSNR